MANFGPFDAEMIEAEFVHDNANLPSDIKGVEVYAIGGGTVGNYYANNTWAYRVHYVSGGWDANTDFYAPSAHTHRDVAEEVASLYTKEF